MKWKLNLLVILLLLTNCDKDDSVSSRKPVLDISTHETLDISLKDTPIFFDFRWRFISYINIGQEVQVTGAWDVILRNESSSDYEVQLSSFSFEDDNDFQIAEYAPIDGIETITVSANGTNSRQGNFKITVGSVTIANRIHRIRFYVYTSRNNS